MTSVATVATPDAATWRRARLLAVVGAVGAALILWAVVELAFGHDLRGPAFGTKAETMDVGPTQVLVVSLLAAVAGWGGSPCWSASPPAPATCGRSSPWWC